MTNPLQTTVDFPVFKFCKKHGINCSWDFNKQDGVEWTEILTHNGDMVFQVSDNMPVDIFIQLVRAYIKEYGTKEISNIGSSDMWWAVAGKKQFDKFIRDHNKIFKENGKKK